MSAGPASWTVRAATAGDTPLLIAFRTAMFLDMGLDDQSRLDEAAERFGRYAADAMAARSFLAWIAEDGEGVPVGSAAVTLQQNPPSYRNPTGSFGYLSTVYVVPERRRQGVASSLVDAALDELQRRGVGVATLHFSEDARALYEKKGFARHDEMRLFLRDRRKESQCG